MSQLLGSLSEHCYNLQNSSSVYDKSEADFEILIVSPEWEVKIDEAHRCSFSHDGGGAGFQATS